MNSGSKLHNAKRAENLSAVASVYVGRLYETKHGHRLQASWTELALELQHHRPLGLLYSCFPAEWSPKRITFAVISTWQYPEMTPRSQYSIPHLKSKGLCTVRSDKLLGGQSIYHCDIYVGIFLSYYCMVNYWCTKLASVRLDGVYFYMTPFEYVKYNCVFLVSNGMTWDRKHNPFCEDRHKDKFDMTNEGSLWEPANYWWHLIILNCGYFNQIHCCQIAFYLNTNKFTTENNVEWLDTRCFNVKGNQMTVDSIIPLCCILWERDK